MAKRRVKQGDEEGSECGEEVKVNVVPAGQHKLFSLCIKGKRRWRKRGRDGNVSYNLC